MGAVGRDLGGQRSNARFKQRGFYFEPLSGAVALMQGGQYAGRKMDACHNVHNRRPGLHRRPGRIARCAHDAGQGLNNGVKRGVGAVRAGLAIARARRVNNARVDPLQVLIAQPQLVHGPGGKVLDDNIGVCHKLFEQFFAAFGFEIERDALFIRVEHHKGITLLFGVRNGKNTACALTVGTRLDLNDLGTEQPQHLGGIGTVKDVGEIKDADIVECSHRQSPHQRSAISRGRERQASAGDFLKGEERSTKGKENTQEVDYARSHH